MKNDLAALYSYVVEQICVANAMRETPPIDSCINVLATVKEAWEQLPDQEKKGNLPTAVLEQSAIESAGQAGRQPVGLSLKA